VLGQEAVGEKANEFVFIPLLLRHLDVRGAVVTIDEMGIQTEIAQTILDGGGDYVLALNENWPATYAEIEEVFTSAPPDLPMQSQETVDADHGRIETRRHTMCHDIDWLLSGRIRFPRP